jgi:NAD(P)H-dependent flavin oxidoreductase YrpB (nitropropane dioxygenase family)
MVWTAGWKLAVAVSEAGGLGLIGVVDVGRPAAGIRKAKAASRALFGVNIPPPGRCGRARPSDAEEGVRTCCRRVPAKYTHAEDAGCIVATSSQPKHGKVLRRDATTLPPRVRGWRT